MHTAHRTAKNPKIFLIALALTAIVAAALGFGAPSATAGGGIAIEQRAGQDTTNKKRYSRLWDRTPKRQRRWANRTARCESGRDPRAIGGDGLYRGAFQFRKDTWRRAPKSPGGDPIRFSYKTQAVVAVALKRRDGAHHWPSCG